MLVLPEIGGRIFAARDKVTDYDFFYRQHVIKPGLIGALGSWISGGVEFNWPYHHRPSGFLPCDFETEECGDGSVICWLSEHDPIDRMKGMVGIVLTSKRNHCQSGIIRVPADKGLTSEYGLAMISNCITMTPGTITVDVAEDEEGNNYYYVHWIDVAEMDREKAGDIIKGTMEKWIGRIWK